MRKTALNAILTGLLGVVGCGGGDDNPLNIPAKIAAMEDCLPDLWPKVSALSDVAHAARIFPVGTMIPPDPAGLSSVANAGVLSVTYMVSGCVLNMEISFWSPLGVQQFPDFTGATSLGEQIKIAADDLAQKFGASPDDPFMLGRWTIDDGVGTTGSGNLLGVIGGIANQNELERLKTTEDTPNGGEPPIDDSIIQNVGKDCVLLFRFANLETDTMPNQDYAGGVITFSVDDGNQTAKGTITLNNTAIAIIKIDGVPGTYEFNIDTLSIKVSP